MWANGGPRNVSGYMKTLKKTPGVSKTSKRANVCLCILAITGVCMIVGGIIMMYVNPGIMREQVVKKMLLAPGTDVYEKWKTPPLPIYFQFYFFDLKNPDEVVKYGAKPIVTEKGPYTYRGQSGKENITFHDNGTVSFLQRTYYHFERAKSVGPETDTFTTINLPILGLSAMTRFKSNYVQYAISMAVSSVGDDVLFQKHTVGGFLWGYPMQGLKSINDVTEMLFDAKYLDDKFGLFYKNKFVDAPDWGNGSYNGVQTVFTGETDVEKFNVIDRWNGLTHLNTWGTKYANMINGTDGNMYHPHLRKTEKLYAFATQICRSVYSTFEKEVKMNGITLYKFSQPKSLYENATVNPDNIGYCTPDCLGTGVFNISACKLGAPVIISHPHFYMGDQKYVDAIGGMRPQKHLHESYASLEPNVGVAFDSRTRIQMNAYIRKTEMLPGTEHLHGMLYPFMWMSVSATMDETLTNEFRDGLIYFLKLVDVFPWINIDLGILTLFCCFVLVAGKFW